ncbi:DMT family transporter [Kitasatospora azatica]|uniref:DMT family transporter n=1 Tax=Kitasatospora azatica TaxID=58347 RepID=UPI00056253DA|nr:DMT family transporter [Kitasatospora azatica]
MRAAHIKMTVATVFLGSYLVASKVILREVPVFTATFVRLVSASLVLAVYVALKPPGRVHPGRRDSTVLLAQALLGVFAFSVFAMYGVKFTGAIEAGVILGMVPISVSLVALVLLKESISSRRGGGIALAVLGALSINVMSARTSAGSPGSHLALGTLLLVCAVLCEAVFMTFGKLLTKPIPPAALSLILSAVGALVFAVPTAIEFDWGMITHISWQTWALMIYTGVAVNGVAAVLMYDSLDTVDTAVAAAFTALTPVIGAVLSIVFLGERLHPYHLTGMALVGIGVFVVATGPNGSDGSQKRVPRRRTLGEPVPAAKRR